MAKKILVIEDDAFLGKIIKRKLLKENYAVVEALDGEEGLNVAKEEKPDIILLDLVLPEMDGFEVLAKLKADPQMSKIPVLILSNLGRKEEITKRFSVTHILLTTLRPRQRAFHNLLFLL